MKDQLAFEKAEIEGSLIARWRRVVEHYPLHPAVTTADGEHYTYAEFDQASNRLAHALLDALGPENCPIVLLLDHSYPLLVSILGVLKAGKAYVALDTTQAVGQLQLLNEIADAPILVTDQEHYSLAQALVAKANHAMAGRQTIWRLETLPEIQASCPDIPVSPDANAALLFTSGTVKQPKGIVRSQRMALYQAWYALGIQPFGPGHRMAGIRHCGSGGGMPYLFYALLYGATYCLYDLQHSGLRELAGWLQRERITYLPLQIGLFRQWLQMLAPGEFYPHLRYIEPAGRKTRADLEPLWSHVGNDCVIHTCYAATEVNQISGALIDRSTPLPEGVLHVGAPLPDQKVIIIKENGRNAPVGEIGEIFVCSRHVPGGYWRQPELSAEWFTPTDDGSGETIWRTGDFGCWRDDGNLEIVGRQDSQVKLRGYRVVLGEIEDALRSLPDVKDAVVTADEERGLLFAYVVAAAEPAPLPAALRAAAAAKLPHYALPNQFIFLPRFPLLAGGKVNRRALPAPELDRTGVATPFVPPRNDIELQLAAIWEGLLAFHPIGVHDNFFELGGHSIAAMRLLFQLEQHFQQPVALRQFIFAPTIAHLATVFGPPPAAAADDAQQLDAEGVPASVMDNAELRRLYDALEDKAEIDRQRDQVRVKRPLPRLLRLLWRLPQPLALRVLYQLVQQPRAQQRFFPRQTALVQQFLAGLEPPPAPEQIPWLAGATHNESSRLASPLAPHPSPLPSAQTLARCLFFGALSEHGMRTEIFARLQAADSIPIAGLEALAAARSRQQGVILLTSHNYQSPYFRHFRLAQGWTGNMTLLTSNGSFDKTSAEHILYSRQLELARQRLQQGQVVYIAPDVNRGHGTQIALPFHGRLHTFRTSFAELALLTGAQLFFVASDLQQYDRFSFHLVGPFDMGTTALAHEARVQHLLAQYVANLRQQWARNPWALQWWLMQAHLAYPQAAGQMQ